MSADPSRPLACIPLRPSLRAWLYREAVRDLEDARAQVDEQRARAEDETDPRWREALFNGVAYLEARVQRASVRVLRWGGGW